MTNQRLLDERDRLLAVISRVEQLAKRYDVHAPKIAIHSTEIAADIRAALDGGQREVEPEPTTEPCRMCAENAPFLCRAHSMETTP